MEVPEPIPAGAGWCYLPKRNKVSERIECQFAFPSLVCKCRIRQPVLKALPRVYAIQYASKPAQGIEA
jgi:hypothetical protein